MKEQVNKGIVGYILSGLLFLLVGGLIAGFYHLHANAERMYENGDRYNPQISTGVTAINITAILPEPIAEVDTGTFLYLVEYDGTGFVALETLPDDKELRSLLEKRDTLATQPMVLAVKAVDTILDEGAIEDYASSMRELLAQESEIASFMVYDSYVSLSEVRTIATLMYASAGFLVMVAGVLFIRAYLGRRANRLAYHHLYQTYPELEGNLDLLLSQATYQNDRLQLVIYKEHLVTYERGFRAIALPDVSQVFVTTSRRYDRLLIPKREDNLIVKTKDNHRRLAMPIKSPTKYDMIQDFFSYLASHYPEIKID